MSTMEGEVQRALGAARDAMEQLSELEEAAVLAARQVHADE